MLKEEKELFPPFANCSRFEPDAAEWSGAVEGLDVDDGVFHGMYDEWQLLKRRKEMAQSACTVQGFHENLLHSVSKFSPAKKMKKKKSTEACAA